MNIRHASLLAVLALGMVVEAGAETLTWAARRQAAVDRPRPVVYNTDGCDILYWPSNLPVSVENFTHRRLRYAPGTRITTVAYCPQSAGFGHFTCLKAGERLTGDVPNPGYYNAAAQFFALGTDSLEMASRFCATNGLETFVSIRVNDQHDSSSRPGDLSALYPPFKLEHPECLMGALDRSDLRQKELYGGYAGWSCVNFAEKLVRERMKKFVRELVENYDVDGIEYDFNRHFMLFRSVAVGGVATQAEVDTMTDFMRELKAITEEVGRRKNRPIVIAMRMPDSVAFDLAVGCDIVTWFRERLVDIWIGGGYFLLNQLPESVALAHRYGIKFYWSLDESRIPRYVQRKGLPILDGRMTLPFYAARLSAAAEAGCDGVYFFNTEDSFLRQVSSLGPEQVRTMEKLYYATERGTDGYTPDHWMKDGARFNNMPQIDPGKPYSVKPGETYAFRIFLGDDFGNGPKVALEGLTGLTGGIVTVKVNGATHKASVSADGRFSVNLAPKALHEGLNDFAVTFPSNGPATTFNDFLVRVRP